MKSIFTCPSRRLAQSLALAFAVHLPGFLMAGEKIIFSNRSSTQAPNVPPAQSAPMFEPDFKTSRMIRMGEPEMPTAPRSASARPALTKRQLEMIDRRKNWIFEKPEDIGKNELADTSLLEPDDALEDRNGKPVTALERFLEGEHRKSDGKPAAKTSGVSSEKEREPLQRADTSLEIGSRDRLDSFSRTGDNRSPSDPFAMDRRPAEPLLGSSPSQNGWSGQLGTAGLDSSGQRARQSESRVRSDELSRLLNPGWNAPTASGGEGLFNSGGLQKPTLTGGGLGELMRNNQRVGSLNSQSIFRGLESSRNSFDPAPGVPSWTGPDSANPVPQPAPTQPNFQKPAILEIPKRKF